MLRTPRVLSILSPFANVHGVSGSRRSPASPGPGRHHGGYPGEDRRGGRTNRIKVVVGRIPDDLDALLHEIGVERGRFRLGGHPVAIEHRVTNVYLREGGAWKLVHHHTDVSPAMLEVLAKL